MRKHLSLKISPGRVLLLVGCGLAVVAQVLACSTPVYRYAMYSWEPAPYEVYFFHDQAADEQHQKVAKKIAEYSESREQRANVIYIPINVAEDKELARIPPYVKQAFAAHPDPQLPSYLIATPFGAEIHFGKLDEAAVAALVESPARTAIGEQLAAGNIGVLVFLATPNEAVNKQVEGVISPLVDDVKQGKIELYLSPYGDGMESAEETAPAGPKLELGFVKVVRNDPQEQWLVRMLLAMEPELQKQEGPMVFMVYGRGRALFPCIDKEITRDNLLYAVEFITGACSCTVKEQNPGVDLLVLRDWESAAISLAEKFSAEEGAPGMFYPELSIPSGAPPNTEPASVQDQASSAPAPQGVVPTAEAKEPPPTTVPGLANAAMLANREPVSQTDPGKPSQTVNAASQGTQASEMKRGESAQASDEPASELSPAGETSKTVASALASEASAAEAEPVKLLSITTTRTHTSAVVVAAGVAVAVLSLFALTFFVLRPR